MISKEDQVKVATDVLQMLEEVRFEEWYKGEFEDYITGENPNILRREIREKLRSMIFGLEYVE
jgi:hypothetical protein